MLRTARLMLVLGLVAGASPLRAQAAAPTVVVLTFENGGSYGLDSLDFSGLGRAIPAALTADLARNPGLRTVARGEAQRVIDRDGLSRGGRVDAATAARVGKQVGAGFVVTGTFVDYYGKMRIDARLIDAGTGAILEVVSSGQRARAELPQMIADIAVAADVGQAAAGCSRPGRRRHLVSARTRSSSSGARCSPRTRETRPPPRTTTSGR